MEEQHAFLGPLLFHPDHRCGIVWLHRHRRSLVCDSKGSLLHLLDPVPVQSSEWADTAVPPVLKRSSIKSLQNKSLGIGNKVGSSWDTTAPSTFIGPMAHSLTALRQAIVTRLQYKGVPNEMFTFKSHIKTPHVVGLDRFSP